MCGKIIKLYMDLDKLLGDKFISVKDCADMLGVHYDTLKRAIYSGKLRAFRVGKRKLRILPNDLITYLNNSRYPVNIQNK